MTGGDSPFSAGVTLALCRSSLKLPSLLRPLMEKEGWETLPTVLGPITMGSMYAAGPAGWTGASGWNRAHCSFPGAPPTLVGSLRPEQGPPLLPWVPPNSGDQPSGCPISPTPPRIPRSMWLRTVGAAADLGCCPLGTSLFGRRWSGWALSQTRTWWISLESSHLDKEPRGLLGQAGGYAAQFGGSRRTPQHSRHRASGLQHRWWPSLVRGCPEWKY